MTSQSVLHLLNNTFLEWHKVIPQRICICITFCRAVHFFYYSDGRFSCFVCIREDGHNNAFKKAFKSKMKTMMNSFMSLFFVFT